MFAKRIFDIVFSALGLIILMPVFIIIGIVIKLTSSGGIFFRQTRVGQYGIPFSIHKFRTMVTDAESKGLKITVGADNRITTIGRVLRKTKLDELPQLIDVLFGDMSFVGPRPEVPEYVAVYPDNIKQKILSIRPGITDRASIEMIDENEILAKSNNPEQTYINEILPIKLNYAVEYIDNYSFFGDIKIILETLKKIIIR
ncbi:MAG: sugar transferase [Neisseriaceae bacterium]|nr:MAG: sugar transferase [Neisseriaceae bacterium]